MMKKLFGAHSAATAKITGSAQLTELDGK